MCFRPNTLILPIICPVCETANSSKLTHCKNCGTLLEQASNDAEPNPPAANPPVVNAPSAPAPEVPPTAPKSPGGPPSSTPPKAPPPPPPH